MDPGTTDFQNWNRLSMSLSLTFNWNWELSLKCPRPAREPVCPLDTSHDMESHYLGDLHFNCKEFWWVPFKKHIFTLNLPLSNFHSMVLISSDGELKNKSNLTSI